jgi:hypothetical protein
MGRKLLIGFLTIAVAFLLYSCDSDSGGSGATAFMRVENRSGSTIYDLTICGADYGTVYDDAYTGLKEVSAGGGTAVWTWEGDDYQSAVPALDPGTSWELTYYGGYNWQEDEM